MAGLSRGEEDIRVQQVGIRLAGVCDRTSRCDLVGLRGCKRGLSSVVIPKGLLDFGGKRMDCVDIYPTLPRLTPLLVGT